MSRIEGVGRRAVAARADDYAARFVAAIRDTLRAVTAGFSGLVTADDLGAISTEWTRRVDDSLLAGVGAAYLDAADATHSAQRDEVEKLLVRRDALRAATEEFVVPRVGNKGAEEVMSTARNRLVNVGNEVWELARGELLAGIQAGDTIEQLRGRVMNATGLATPHAEVIARSEVARAMNTGSLDQMKQLGVVGTRKEWIATLDLRTRPDHRAMNGKTVGINETFSIGYEPGDAPNCRCTYGFDLPDDDLAASVAPTLTESLVADEGLAAATATYRAADGDAEKWLADNVDRIAERVWGGNSKLTDPNFKGEDLALTELAAHQYGRLPHLGSEADVDRAVAAGWQEVWRGTRGLEGLNSFRHAVTYPMGRGIYGNGVYTSTSRAVADDFRNYGSKAKSKGAVMRMAINPNARVVDYDELLRERDAWNAQRNAAGLGFQSPEGGLLTGFSQDEGVFATMRGYDVIRVRNRADGTKSRKKQYADQYVILNRSAVIVESENR